MHRLSTNKSFTNTYGGSQKLRLTTKESFLLAA